MKQQTIVNGVRYVLVGWIVAAGFFFCVVRPFAQTQDTLNERYSTNIETLKQEVNLLRNGQFETRISALENTIVEVKWLGRTAAGVLLGQLLLGIMATRKKTS